MGGLSFMSILMVIMVIASFVEIQRSQAQIVYTVGDSIGWNVPSAGPDAYSTWAALHNFTVGDVLFFNFTTDIHDVAEVTQAGFKACNSANPISVSATGPANITLRSVGNHYFICTVSAHCTLGQTLAIKVSSAPSTPPAPQPSGTTLPPVSTPTPVAPSGPSTTMTPPVLPAPAGGVTSPPPSSFASHSFAAITLPITFLSVALVFLY